MLMKLRPLVNHHFVSDACNGSLYIRSECLIGILDFTAKRTAIGRKKVFNSIPKPVFGVRSTGDWISEFLNLFCFSVR